MKSSKKFGGFVFYCYICNRNKNNMKTKIDITKYEHVDEIYWGLECKSSHNHNYYYSSVLGDVILEECDDDGYFEYWRLNGYSIQRLGGYYGGSGIFEDESEIVELDSQI